MGKIKYVLPTEHHFLALQVHPHYQLRSLNQNNNIFRVHRAHCCFVSTS